MDSEIDQYFPALRHYVEKHKRCKARNKVFFPLFIITFLGSAAFVPAAVLWWLVILIWYGMWFQLGSTKCPRCNESLATVWTRFGAAGGSLMPGYFSCASCGLKICDLPEIECRAGKSHDREWIE